MLRRGETFFASAAEMNDTNEFKPHFVFSGTTELWIRFVDHIFMNAFRHPYFFPDNTKKVLL